MGPVLKHSQPISEKSRQKPFFTNIQRLTANARKVRRRFHTPHIRNILMSKVALKPTQIAKKGFVP
jgi:hypothetical protein